MNYEILVATNNQHKLYEIRKILSPHHITVYGMNDLNINVEEPNETGKTYFENALIKAKSLQNLTKMPIIADDSGLEIVAMNNEPGIFSARFAEANGGHENAIKKILKTIEGKERTARFVCSICLLNVEKQALKFEAIINGQIALSANGTSGFGYDPIFIENDTNKTYASMSEEEKNLHSHRAKALKKLLTYLRINNLVD